MKIIDKYKITYDNGFIQEKNLISYSDYLDIIKDIQNKVYDLEVDNYKKNKDKIKALKSKQISLFGENWFTSESPLFKAIETNILTLSIGGKIYNYNIKLEKF